MRESICPVLLSKLSLTPPSFFLLASVCKLGPPCPITRFHIYSVNKLLMMASQELCLSSYASMDDRNERTNQRSIRGGGREGGRKLKEGREVSTKARRERTNKWANVTLWSQRQLHRNYEWKWKAFEWDGASPLPLGHRTLLSTVI